MMTLKERDKLEQKIVGEVKKAWGPDVNVHVGFSGDLAEAFITLTTDELYGKYGLTPQTVDLLNKYNLWQDFFKKETPDTAPITSTFVLDEEHVGKVKWVTPAKPASLEELYGA